MEGIGSNSSTKGVVEKKGRPQEQLNCPRCSSTNTKFCYYNNYSLTQPRYLCKTCRRYWTEGGSLRNVPVGGGSRKNKKLTSSSKVLDLDPPSLISAISSQNPKMHDLNLAFPANSVDKYHGMSPYVDMPKLEIATHTTATTTNSSSSAIELLRSSMASRGLSPYVASNSLMSLSSSDEALFSSTFPMQEIKPSLGFSVDGLGNRSYENISGGGRQILFPFGGETKQIPSSVEVEHIKEQGNSTGYWTGMIGEGSSW